MNPLAVLKLFKTLGQVTASKEELCEASDDLLDLLEAVAEKADKNPDKDNLAEKALKLARQLQVAVCGEMPD